ncbi:PAS domain S-box protein [bacterium BFN5]|nr:PAS domain S-box protein [bacterium BFN5]QJW46877.1 PAS domain S-box protein [bacterium BFN5]
MRDALKRSKPGQPSLIERKYTQLEHLLLSATQDIILIVKPNGLIVDVNDTACAAYGYSLAEMGTLSVFDLRYNDTRSKIAEQLLKSSHSGIIFEALHRRKDGSTFPVEVNSRAGLLGDDKIIVSIVRDISTRRKAEKKLQRSNRALKTLTEIMQAIVQYDNEEALMQEICRISIDVGGHKLAWIGGLADHASKEAKTIAISSSTAGSKELLQGMWHPIWQENSILSQVFQNQCPVVIRDHEKRIVDLLDVQLRRHNYKSLAVLPIVVSGTTEAVLALFASDMDAFDSEEINLLSRLANNIAHALFSLRIHAASQNAKELERLARLDLIGQMAASIGHEVRNPMTTVKGFLQMMLYSGKVSNYQEFFPLMIQELDRANVIISDFLSLAKNKMTRKEPKMLNDILESLYPLITVEATSSSQTIRYELGDIPRCMLDENEIKQLFLNLIKNALEAMPSRGTVWVRTYCWQQFVILEVEDEGCGIPSNIIDKVGTPFFTTKESGTGLGLPVCYSIAFRHQANLDIRSNQAGTLVEIKFPICSDKKAECSH